MLERLVAEQLADAGARWAIGTFGAIAEFGRDAREPVRLTARSAVTARGAIRVSVAAEVRIVAWERPIEGERWTQGVALCLSQADSALSGRTAIAELGPDRDALHEDERGAPLFDLGLGAPHCEFCVRTRDPSLLRALRASAGRPALEPGLLGALAATSPARVLVSRLGRIEVRTPIPPPGGRTPDGPHTHLLPELLKHRRTHSANVPIAAGWVPCAELFPAAERFADLYARHAAPGCLRAKEETIAAVRAGKVPRDNAAYGRAERQARRVALRQLAQADGPSAALSAWRRAFDLET